MKEKQPLPPSLVQSNINDTLEIPGLGDSLVDSFQKGRFSSRYEFDKIGLIHSDNIRNLIDQMDINDQRESELLSTGQKVFRYPLNAVSNIAGFFADPLTGPLIGLGRAAAYPVQKLAEPALAKYLTPTLAKVAEGSIGTAGEMASFQLPSAIANKDLASEEFGAAGLGVALHLGAAGTKSLFGRLRAKKIAEKAIKEPEFIQEEPEPTEDVGEIEPKSYSFNLMNNEELSKLQKSIVDQLGSGIEDKTALSDTVFGESLDRLREDPYLMENITHAIEHLDSVIENKEADLLIQNEHVDTRLHEGLNEEMPMSQQEIYNHLEKTDIEHDFDEFPYHVPQEVRSKLESDKYFGIEENKYMSQSELYKTYKQAAFEKSFMESLPETIPENIAKRIEIDEKIKELKTKFKERPNKQVLKRIEDLEKKKPKILTQKEELKQIHQKLMMRKGISREFEQSTSYKRLVDLSKVWPQAKKLLDRIHAEKSYKDLFLLSPKEELTNIKNALIKDGKLVDDFKVKPEYSRLQTLADFWKPAKYLMDRVKTEYDYNRQEAFRSLLNDYKQVLESNIEQFADRNRTRAYLKERENGFKVKEGSLTELPKNEEKIDKSILESYSEIPEDSEAVLNEFKEDIKLVDAESSEGLFDLSEKRFNEFKENQSILDKAIDCLARTTHA